MSITGARFLGTQFRDQLTAVKQALSKAGDEMTGALAELQEVAGHAQRTVQSVKSETAELKAALGLHTNDEPAAVPTANGFPVVGLNEAGVVPEAK